MNTKIEVRRFSYLVWACFKDGKGEPSGQRPVGRRKVTWEQILNHIATTRAAVFLVLPEKENI